MGSVCRWVAGLLVIVGAGLAAEAQEGEEVICPAAGGPIAVDGRLDEVAWNDAAAIGALVLLETGAAPEHEATTARVAHDGRALYVAIVCTGGRAQPGRRAVRDDGRAWVDDHVELFIDPTPDTEDYYHLVVDCSAASYDAHIAPETVTPRGADWNGDWEAAVGERAGGWVVECAIPPAVLGADGVKPGDLWRFKVGRDGGKDGPIMWPRNLSRSFHSRDADGALYFDTENLLANGGFEEGPEFKGVPQPWQPALTSPEVNNAPQGEFRTVEEGAATGRRALLFEKLPQALYWPQVWSPPLKLESAGTYEFSVALRGSIASVSVRANVYPEGGEVIKLAEAANPTPDWGRYRLRFTVPPETREVAVGLSAPAGAYGRLLCDDAVLRRLVRAQSARSAVYAAPDWSPDPNPVHGLEALRKRAGHKPWDLFERDGGLLTYRVIFRDRKHGTPLWLLDNSPDREYVVTASIWPGWNADNSVMQLPGDRRVGGEARRPWLCNADFSRLTPMPGGMPLWDLEDPDVFYRHSPGKVERINWRTGDTRVLATWEPRTRERSYGLTKDNRSVFVVDHDGGSWVPYAPGPEPLPYIQVLDCYGTGPDGETLLPLQVAASETDAGPIIRILVGTRVYTDTGRTERVIVPISGRREYLETFASGRIQFPTDAAPPETKDLDELFRVYQLYPSCSHGHLSYSPDGEYICWDGGPSFYRTRDGREAHNVNISPNGSCYHTCWFINPRFFTSCVRAYRTNYDRPLNAGILAQVFTDGTWQPICDIKMRPNAYYYGGNFATFSRDGTKIHYESNMLGVPQNYIAVMARPQPPRDVSWRADGRAIVLSWSPPPYHREIKGTLVYRSDRSGDGYELLTPQPVTGTSFRDETVVAGRAYHYVLTSLEHFGLESGYSEEASRAGIELPAGSGGEVVLYAEAEDALADLGSDDRPGLSTGRDALTASNWYYVYRTPGAERGAARLRASVAVSGAYHLWLRVRSADEAPAGWALSVDERAIGEARATGPEWTWMSTVSEGVRLAAGPHEVELSTTDGGAQLDLLCLATDPGFRPDGPRPEDRRPPESPRNLTVRGVRDRTVQLAWDPPGDADFSHFNVYGSREALTGPEQEHLLASPTYPEFIDWGLRPGTLYHYAVTAVDRRGNESALSGQVEAQTPPPASPRHDTELLFEQATLEGSFEFGEGPGTHGKRYVILPETIPANEAARATATWTINVPDTGTHYLWLRYLPRGAASSREAAVVQDIRALLDGQRIASVGGGETDLSTPDSSLRPEFWTWARPVRVDLVGVDLPAGEHELRLENLTASVRYDSLLLTNEPSFLPPDGRLRQR